MENTDVTITDGRLENAAPEKFNLNTLREYSYSIFKIDPCIFDGACQDLDGNQLYTIKDIMSHIQKWLNKEV